MAFKRGLLCALAAVAMATLTVGSVLAQSPARERELICSDGTTFNGEQVRAGYGTPPNTWRNVNPSEFPTAFVFHAAAVVAPDGELVEEFTWDHTHGAAHPHELVTCSFVIPIGDLAGYRADFIGYFVP